MNLTVEKRSLLGKKVKALSKQGILPAVIYSKKISKKKEPSTLIQIDCKEFIKIYEEAGTSSLIDLQFENENIKVLIHETQKHPVTDNFIHVSFFKVDLKEKITANIPIEIIDEEENEAVKTGVGTIIHILKEIEIECLPEDLPSHFEISSSTLKDVGDVLVVKDVIKVDPKKIEITPETRTQVIAKLDYLEQQEVEAIEPEATGVEEVGVITKKDKEPEKPEPQIDNKTT